MSSSQSVSQSLSVAEILAEPGRAAVIRVDARFAEQHRGNLDWLLDRLSKSTAGVRGLIAASPKLKALSIEEAERTPQLSPTVVALIAQAYARYFLAGGAGEGAHPAAAF